MDLMKNPLLLGCKGCGNAIVESAFALAGVPVDCEEVDYSATSPTRERLLAVNPLGQVPALVLPDGRVLTESLAMLHYLDDVEPGANLIPARGDAARASLRWRAQRRAWTAAPGPVVRVARAGRRRTRRAGA